MITYGSTTLTSYNTITNIEVYYYKSTSATSLSGGSWSTTKPTWENGKYIWQKIRTTYEGKLENGQFYSESDPVNITGQQGATGTAAYSYKLNASDTTITVSKTGVYSTNKITFTATSKQGTGSVNAYAGRFKIETTVNGTTWTAPYTSNTNESSKEYTIPTGIIAIRCSLYQANGTTTLLDIMTIPILSDDRPIATKTYSGLIGSANDAANASFYFAKIHPDNYTTNYKVKMKVRVTAPEAYAETIDIQFGGYGNTFSSFDAYTTRTGSIGIYYINLYRATQAGISTNHKGHALGIGLCSSTNPTSTSYKRTVIIDILELDGCTIEMLDTAVKYASIDGTGSTNYYGLTEMTVATAGQNATNNTNTSYTQYANAVKAGTFGVKRYTLLMKDSENTWSSFINQANSTATTKTVCQGGFLLGKLLYSAGGAEYASGANTSTVYDAYPFDFRYSTNCGQTLISHQPVYLVGTIENDGLFYLDVSQWWTQTEPTYADGKVYIYVGMAYSAYQVWLSTENPAYVYYNGEFILYDKAQTLQNIDSLKTSLETQIDSKVETWCQKTNPATSWTAEERPNHTGDLWYYIGESDNTYKNNTTYQYNGSTNTWSAYSANPDLFDKIDGKTAIYYGTTSSVTSAEEGDYLVDSTDGSSYRWNNGAWVKVTDYKTAINNIQIGGRNLLRNTSITRTGVATKYGLLDILTPTYSSLYALDLDEGEYTLSFDWESSIELPASFYAWIGYGDINGRGRAEMPQNIPAVYTGKDSTSGHYVRTFIWANANDTYPYFACRPFRTSVEDALNDIEFTIKNAKLEKGNKATDWTPAPEDVEDSIKSYAQSIQSQVDGMAEIHYGTIVPTLSNAPYTSWEDTTTRDMHVDDLYYNTSTGYCYRFTKSGSTYSWTRIKDSDITAAATAASNANTAAGNAQTTANNANTLAGQKRRIFVAQPTPPYEVGDLWVEGSNGDIKKCKTARATGSYTASDWELASKYTDDTKANIINNAIISRGEQLVINGNGMMESNYNFSSLTFDGSKSNGSPGSFTRPAETATYNIYSDEFFPVTPSNTYVLSFDLMSLNNLSTMYAFIDFYDVDKKQISAKMYMYRPNTLTTLSQDLKNGDTVVHLTDASNWETTGSYNHGFIFWNYVNSFGYQYPEHTYSRNTWGKLFDLSNINKTNNTITLNGAWNHGTFPAGTKLSQSNSGATFKYLGIGGSIVPNTWTSYKGRIGDIDYSGTNMIGMFPPGTAYAKVGFVWNYNKANDQIWVTNISVKEDVTRGTGFYAITTAPTTYTTQVGNFTPAYRIPLSTVKTQSGLEEVMVGDVIQQGYNTYPVGYVDNSYVYLGSANSIRGATGATGLNNAQVILYRRFASAPSGTNVAPTGDVTYTFSTGKVANNLNSWTQNIPSGSDPVYMIAASASSTSSTDTIPKTEWSAPVKILENGQDGGTGSAGADGYNQATIFLYQRKSGAAPSKPSSAVTYTFSSGALSSTPTGWSRTIPANNGNPCYVTTATAVAKTATYSIPANGWSDVVILSQDGEDGTSITITSTSVKYQKGTSGTTAPTGTWGTSIPTVGENEFLWTQTIVNYSDNSKTESYSVSRNAKNGTNGTSPTVSSTTVKYQQSTGGTTPPTGTWSTTAPTATAGQYMWTRTTVTYSDSKTAVSYSVSKNGTNGTSPTAYHLIVSHGAINKSQAGVYNPTTITLTSKYQTGNGALNNYSGRFKIETTTDNNTWTQDSASSTANESSKTYTIPANMKAVRFSLYLAGGFTTLLDQQTVPVVTDGAKGDNGEDAYTIVLTNEAHTFPAGVSAALAGSATSSVMTYKGGIQVACFAGSTSSATSISTGTTGLTCAINNNNSKNVSLTFTATTSLTTRAGTVTIPITVDNKSFSKTFTWSLANQGIKGEDGVSVTNVTSTNNTADGGTSVVTVTLSNGTTKTFNVKNGSKGNTGATAQWYYGTSLTHTSGTATLVATSTSGAVVGSMYLNTQTSLVYKCTAVGTNNTWIYAGDLTTGVIDNIEIGGRNLLKGTRTQDVSYGNYQNAVTVTNDTFLGCTVFKSSTAWADIGFNLRTQIINKNLVKAGDILTYSVWAKTDDTENRDMYGIWVGSYIRGSKIGEITSEWQQYYKTFEITQAMIDETNAIPTKFECNTACSSGKYIYWAAPKLERGTKATDWTPAPEDTQADIDTALAQSVEYIIGTQTAATGNWAGKSSTLTELKDGTQIRYWLPYAGSGNATLNLTLKNGTATGAIPVYRQGGSASSTGVVTANRVTTHFPAGTSISMVYGVNRIVSAVYSGTTYTGTFTGWFADGAYDSGNTINRTRLQNVITAETAITAAHIICGTATGYKNIGAGINFDLSYPILYASSAIAATKTGDNNYLQINEINASNNGTIQSGATKKVLYLKGTVSGNIFTISASPFMTTATPTSADGFYYIPLGMMYSTTNIYFISSNRLYAYLDSAFQPVDTAAILRAAEAKKTATNYMSSDNTGIMVADLADGEQLPANATGGNVFITAGYGEGSSVVDAGVHIRDGQEDLAIYGETTRIGKENDSNVSIDNNGIIINKGSKELAKYFSKGITFDEEIPYKIGNDNSYITFEDTDSDNIADSLSIVADSIYFRDTANTNIKDTLNGLQSDLAIAQEDIDLKNNYIKINTSEPSIVISASSNTNDTNLKLESSQLSFQIDGQTTATITNDQMNIPTASVTNLFMQSTNTSTNTVYEKVWVMRTNGHLSLKTITRN